MMEEIEINLYQPYNSLRQNQNKNCNLSISSIPLISYPRKYLEAQTTFQNLQVVFRKTNIQITASK